MSKIWIPKTKLFPETANKPNLNLKNLYKFYDLLIIQYFLHHTRARPAFYYNIKALAWCFIQILPDFCPKLTLILEATFKTVILRFHEISSYDQAAIAHNRSGMMHPDIGWIGKVADGSQEDTRRISKITFMKSECLRGGGELPENLRWQDSTNVCRNEKRK